jgi:phosphoserine phosphatase RsbU/P
MMTEQSESVADSRGSISPRARFGDWTFRTRLVVGVSLVVLLTGAVVTWLASRSARSSTETLANALFREASRHVVTHTQRHVLRAAPIAESLRELASQGLELENSDRLANQLLAVLKANVGISWVSFANERGDFTGAYRPLEGGLRINQSRIENGKTKLVERDVLPDGRRREFRTDLDSGYDPRKRPFYEKAKAARRLVWLPPYVFFNQGIPGITCAVPTSDGDRLRGVFTIDFDLNALSEFINRLKITENSALLLFTSDGSLLAHSLRNGPTLHGGGDKGGLTSLADVDDPIVKAFRAKLDGGFASEPGAFRSFEFDLDGETYSASTNSFAVGDDLVWTVGAVAPKGDFLANVWASQRHALAAALGAVLVALAFAAAMARRVSKPVQSLIDFMRRVSGGDLESRANFGGGLEFRRLSEALNKMIGDLRDRVRLLHSINVAMEVQQRLLPGKPPVVPGLDVAGHSTYCDETGGDYYDFLVVDELGDRRMMVALGDVMGHGVAAALVMAGARAVLRDRAESGGSLAELMTRLNRLLAEEGTRFMTMHLSVVDADSKTLRWVSAGHDPAIIYDPAADRFDEVSEGDLPLGFMDDGEYQEHEYGPMRDGQIVVVGTAGVWEMPNEQKEQYGKDRLKEAIRAAAAKPAAEIVQEIVARLAAFRGACRQEDDVTFVVVKFGEG